MKKRLYVILFLLVLIIYVDAKKTSRSRSSGSGRGSSRRTSNPQPAPTSFSYPQQTAAKPSLFGWQEKPAQRSQSSSRNSNPQSHSYPSSQTGLSGGSPAKQPPTYQESIQRSNTYNSHAPQQPQGNNKPSHSYPASTGLSGNAGSGYPSQQGGGLSGSGAGYPQQQGKGLSGSGVGYPQQQSGQFSGSGVQPPPYTGSNQPRNNYPQQHPTNYHGNSYNHPPGPPPPYYNNGGYGGRGNYNPGMGPQMPGYFGNYGNNFGSMARPGSSTLSKVGLAGAGIGTVLTGLALWNLARSTGHHHHTVVYDNRGQPVAVAPVNGTEAATDPFLADLKNCSLTISNDNATEVLAIPCAIATSFRPDADLKDSNPIGDSDKDNTKCTITVVTKSDREYMTTIPCSILLSTAAENNVTEPPPFIGNSTDTFNGTMSNSDISPQTLEYTNTNGAQNNYPLNCTIQSTDVQDPINPCLPIMHNLTVIPLQSNNTTTLTPESA